MDGDTVRARRDATLTVVVLVVVAALAGLVRAPITLAALVVGAGATVVVELLLSRRAEWVRSVWDRRAVQATAVVAAVAGGIGLTFLVGPWVLTALASALLTYLVILGGSVVWRHRR